ncbi:hypothetical protein CfE428DRAFT_3959 [Chthoniobacter flavus Ellin428]|uniref:Uncharacterized protein n=1 Tax=Chthoniobacter flavus Ellin428 TaxID=497964 RepID=B4D4X1_9BACT|nr:hypothetical protein CfE428DRAFT_3959 [Chthoniobacter flavus Ellin428]
MRPDTSDHALPRIVAMFPLDLHCAPPAFGGGAVAEAVRRQSAYAVTELASVGRFTYAH